MFKLTLKLLFITDYNAAPLFASENASSEVWSAGGGAGNAAACGSSGMDLKHEVAYRGVLPVKAEPGVSHNGHQANGHVRDWMAGGTTAGSPSPGPPQPQPNNGYSSPLSSSSYGPYSPNGKIEKNNIIPDDINRTKRYNHPQSMKTKNVHKIYMASNEGLDVNDQLT
ncbi:unnamed protein product [Arctia plantaginis]|uniref:Uncharacterized protein n=1 Tax=Arctia plantaginis TaxID=874455 RepID=A0A8S1B9G8_ARCPL|nr:unnamed protein product [Arctia plantaginis]